MEILSLGEKIKRKRKELGMTLKDLAGDRITPGQISLVESGKSNPSMDLLEYLATSLNISVEYLMESEETQAEKICMYFQNIAQSNLLNEQLELAEENLGKCEVYFEKYNLNYINAISLYIKGELYILKSEFGLAQQCLLSANAVFIKNNNFEYIINTYIKLGIITLEMQAYHSASSYFHQAEKIYEDNNFVNDFIIGEIYYYIGNTYFKLEDLDKAMNYSYLANDKFKKINDKKGYAKSLMLLAEEFIKKQNIDEAIKYSNKALKFLRELNDCMYIGKIENNLGRLFFEFDNTEEAFVHFNKAKKIRKEFRNSEYIDTLVNICENYIKLKDIDKAKEILKEILENKHNSVDSAFYKYFLLKYRISMLEDNILEAEETLNLALEFTKKANLNNEYAEILILIGKFYVDNGKDKDAAKYLNEGVEVFKRLGILK